MHHTHARRLTHLILILSMLLPGLAPTPTRAASLYQAGDDTPIPSLTPEASETPVPTETAVPAETEEAITPTLEIPTVTSTLTSTLPAPSPTITATVIPTPLITEVPLPTPIVTATLPAVTPEITPTLTPTNTAAIPILSAAPIFITMDTFPPNLSPGGKIDTTWIITSQEKISDSLSIQFIVPAGFEPSGKFDGVFDANAGLLTLSAGRSQNGHISWKLADDLSNDPVTLTASLLQEDKSVAALTTDQLFSSGSTVSVGGGGFVINADLGVNVSFLPEASSEPMDVYIREPIPDAMPPHSLSGRPFEIIARGQISKDYLHKFDQPITIETPYDGKRDASIFYYDPQEGKWLPLPTIYDSNARILRATSDHLSVFDTGLNDWQMAQMPSVKDSQVAQQTGASVYSFGIWTPPGPGSLQPSLSLSYNSQIADSSIGSLNQAGWVGMGWNLDTGYIQRDMHGTQDGTTDDTFSLSVGGVSSQILLDSSGKYRLANENFWKIEYSGDVWTVYDQQGNTYTFGLNDASRAKYPQYFGNCDPEGYVTWRWSLTEVTNIFGQKLIYSYIKDTKNVDDPCSSTDLDPADIAIYPLRIKYPNDRYFVEFIQDTAVRTDYKSEWWTDANYRTFFNRYRLDKV